MSDLKKALECVIVDPDGVVHQCPHRGHQAAIVDAARRFANLTSPETVEKAEQIIANDLANIAYNRGWSDEHPNEYLKVAKVLVEKVLRTASVEVAE